MTADLQEGTTDTRMHHSPIMDARWCDLTWRLWALLESDVIGRSAPAFLGVCRIEHVSFTGTVPYPVRPFAVATARVACKASRQAGRPGR